jgi:peptidoglycan/xylan/chitin deacetylase (PgdA/CDA1 family)
MPQSPVLATFMRGQSRTAKPSKTKPRRVALNALLLEAREVPATNLIANPSVETAGSVATMPAGWATDNYGKNTPIFSYLSTGLDGQKSVRVEMTARETGDAKWYFTDVPVTAGQTYSFSDLYTSNVATSATIRYKLSNGKYKYVGDYAAPASASASTLAFNFTPPANAVSATVFHILQSVGSLTTDAYSILPAASTPDTTAPAVSISSPTANANVFGTITLSATATDNVGVAGVKFLVDGVQVGSEVTTSPYQMALNTSTLTAGSHAVTAIARDAAGNTKTSTAVNFTVTLADTTLPTVSITSPAANASVSGTINLAASASDNVAVVGVRFFVDGVQVGSEVTASPYQVSLNTSTLSGASHTVTAIARDAAGNSSTSATVAFTIAVADTTLPTVAVTSPTANASVTGTINLTATAADNVGVAGVRFLVDGVQVGAEDTVSPYQVSLNTTTLSVGNHTVTAIARDAAGNSTTSAPIAFAIADTTKPTVAITSPTAGATATGTITLSAQASDNVGVAGVRFYVDGVAVGSEIVVAPYQVSLNSATLGNGNHVVTAVARDAAGNSTTSAAVTFTASNGIPTTTNLIANPSVESLGTNGDPTGWTRNGWGTNSATFSVVPGIDGSRAVRVDMNSYSSGDAKWVFAEVNVTPNTAYTFSNAYRSNTASQLCAQYRLADGTFSFVWIADRAAASTWTNTSYSLTTPANVVSMTVFHLIAAVGWLETDNYSLVAPTGSGGTTGKGMISLTFDDGWLSQLQSAVPVLQQNNLPASFYVITRANQGGTAWNEVLNGSLEAAGTNGSPTKWSNYKNGTNTSTFTYANAGSDGVRSAQIDVSSYNSGEASWYFQDVMVQPGSRYTISHQYNANVPTSEIVRFTLHNGGYSYIDAGSLAATNGQWQTNQLTVTAPANADAMTLMHRISRVGTLSTDNYSVKEVNAFSNTDYMTPAQIQSLQAMGYEVGSHTMTHADLTATSAAGARAEIDGALNDLVNLGINAQTFVYPYGAYNTGIEQVVANAGFIGARTVNDGYNTSTTDRFALYHHEVDLSTTPAQVQSWISAATQSGQWLILTFHQVDHSGDFYSTTPETFQQIAAMVKAANLTPVTMAGGLAKL